MRPITVSCGHRQMVHPAVAEVLFPTDDELLIAIQGLHIGMHRLCQLAHELGKLHGQLLPALPGISQLSAEMRSRRIELMDAIDSWVTQRLPVPHPRASLHTETIGPVIDRMVQAQVRACHLLMTLKVTDDRIHAAWTRLAELADGYTDLTTDIINRARRLPDLGECW